MTVAEILIAGLRERGVEWIASLCGHGLDPLYHAAANAGLRLIDTRNEQTAAYIADAFGKLTRRPGVCAVSSGVAHVNAFSGLLNAWLDGTPMLLVSGAGAFRTAGMGHFQDMDQVTMAAPLTRFARAIDCPERVIELLDQAWRRAMGATPGPVHLTVPLDIQQTEVATDRLAACVPRPSRAPASDPEPIAAALANAEMPLIVAGSGLWYAD
jgi:thiamine pyrophosphate-dependent acetolactate synthase large subunit-like protein